jgi:hypothetical protein
VRVNFFSDMADGRTRERRDSKHADREKYYNSRYENDSYVPHRRRRYEYEGQEEQRGFEDKYTIQARTGGKRCTTSSYS